MLCAHKDDVPNEEDYNLPSWPLDEHGYQYSSLQSIYFDLFLSYKIERAIYPGFEDDTKFGLTAISHLPVSLRDLTLVIEDQKLRYLQEKKAGSMEVSGIGDLTASDLQVLIASKMHDNYVYNLRFDEEHDVSLFDIIIEVLNPQRSSLIKLMAAMEYRPDERLLRLVTLY
jgi:hypothetical protein